jgi:hypothetical protein
VIKVTLVFSILIFGTFAVASDCLESVANYNSGYSKSSNERMIAQQDESAFKARDLFNSGLAQFLEKEPISKIREFAYHLASSVNLRRSQEDNVEDFTGIFSGSSKIDGDSVVEGHKFIKLKDSLERRDLSEVVKFLYVQAVTNSSLDRSKSLLKNLTDCPEYQVFK